VHVPEDVCPALIRYCADCHSNETHWPWYSRVVPFSSVITDDPIQGRRHMNFEDWEVSADQKQAAERLPGISEEIEQKGMSPYWYRLVHTDLRWNPEEITSICSWSQSLSVIPAGPALVRRTRKTTEFESRSRKQGAP
jgi:cytochrome c